MVIDSDGSFVGAPGYPRGNVRRGTAGFSDPAMVNLLPPNGRANNLLDTDLMCKSTQSKPNQSDGSPALKAAPGSMIALRYQENGHVTLPENQLGKPANRGNVYIYGTLDPQPTDTLLKIHKVWNEDGSGGDKRGKLLATQNFDDGQCYQINGGSISKQRQAQFPHATSQLMGADLWCQNDIKLPAEATAGKSYTLYWVWDWPTAPNVDPGLPKGKQEIYTTCMDVEVTDEKTTSVKVAQNNGDSTSNDLGNKAVPGLMDDLKKNPSGGSSPSSSSAQSQSEQPSTSSAPSHNEQPSTSSTLASASTPHSTDTPSQPSGQAPPQSTCACDAAAPTSNTVSTATVTVTATVYPSMTCVQSAITTLAKRSAPSPVIEADVSDISSSSSDSDDAKPRSTGSAKFRV